MINKYIIKCQKCNGTKRVLQKDPKSGRSKHVECSACGGLGVVTYSRDFLMFKVMDLNRKINFLWEVMQHKKPIPESFMCEIEHNCSACDGEGRVMTIDRSNFNSSKKEEECNICLGKGYNDDDLKAVFGTVFKTFSAYRKERDMYNALIEDKTWKRPDIKGLKKIKPVRHLVVCTRCEYYLDEGEVVICDECCNGHMSVSDVSLFKAITPSAAKWYRTDGRNWNNRRYKKGNDRNGKV